MKSLIRWHRMAACRPNLMNTYPIMKPPRMTVKNFANPHESTCANANSTAENTRNTMASLLAPNPPKMYLSAPFSPHANATTVTGRPNRRTRNTSSSQTAAWVKRYMASSSVRSSRPPGVSIPIPMRLKNTLMRSSKARTEPTRSPTQNRGVLSVLSK